MKFSLLTVAGILTAISQASALTIVTPWAQSTWTSGGHGNITWTPAAADMTLMCDIYLLNGNFSNSNIVAQVTNPSTPVACSVGKYDIYPLNDFAAGQYWIRIGQTATNNWAYSGVFTFVGKGTIGPISVAGGTTTATNGTAAVASGVSNSAVAAATGVATASGVKTASSSVSAAAASSSAKSGAESAVSINSAAVALGAIAAIALTL